MAGGTALITGSSGLIGSELVEHLDARGWEVRGADNNDANESNREGVDGTMRVDSTLHTLEIDVDRIFGGFAGQPVAERVS